MNNLFKIFGPAYPTREQILEKEIKHKKETIKILKNWKKNVWKPVKKGGDNNLKFDALEILVRSLSEIYQKPINIIYEPERPSCSYDQLTQTLFINKSLSIISTLHEFAHHLYGPNELQTCRWSVNLFRKIFPRAYNRLKWNRHMLVKDIIAK